MSPKRKYDRGLNTSYNLPEMNTASKTMMGSDKFSLYKEDTCLMKLKQAATKNLRQNKKNRKAFEN